MATLQYTYRSWSSYTLIAKVNAPFSPDSAAYICLSYLQANTAVFLNSKHAFVSTFSQQVAGKIFH